MEFCTTWNTAYKEPTEPITADEARRRHESGDTYTVLVPDASAPIVAIEVTMKADSVSVEFFDDKTRNVRTYVFSDRDGDRLFLQQSFGRVFAPDDEYGDNPTHLDDTITRPTGAIRFTQGAPGATTTSEGTMRPGDMDDLWEPVPSFGDWSSIGRLDRDTANPDPAAYRL